MTSARKSWYLQIMQYMQELGTDSSILGKLFFFHARVNIYKYVTWFITSWLQNQKHKLHHNYMDSICDILQLYRLTFWNPYFCCKFYSIFPYIYTQKNL